MRRIEFSCSGIPAPKGSAKAFFVKKLKRAIITNANPRTKPWEQAVRFEAEAALPGAVPTLEPVFVELVFRFPRPKSHFRKNGELKPSAPTRMQTKPDLDKLERAVLDALTAVVFGDDRQVDELAAKKRYVKPGETPGVDVAIELLEPALATEAA